MKKDNKQTISYIDLGSVSCGSLDKRKGRILGWVKEGFEVDYLCPRLVKEHALKEFPKNESIRIISLPFTRRTVKSAYLIILEYIKRLLVSPYFLAQVKPSYFTFCNSGILADVIPGIFFKLFKKTKYLFIMIDSLVPHPSKRQGAVLINWGVYLESKLVIWLADHFADLIFTVNPVIKEKLTNSSLNKSRIILSENGIFLDEINRVKTKKSKYLASYMGRITENKGVFDLINVWKKVVHKYPQAKLAVMGTGTSQSVNHFKEQIEKSGLEENIDYLGFVNSPRKYKILKQSKVFLFLSKVDGDESWGISLMEALACGLPAVVYDLDIYDTIYPQDLLIKVPVNDWNSVVKALFKLLKDEKLTIQKSKRGKKFSKHFDWLEIARNDLKKVKKATLPQNET